MGRRSRRRHTAKTGDKGIYKQRLVSAQPSAAAEEDLIYDKVDQFHQQQDEIRLSRLSSHTNDDDDDDEDDIDKQEAVMDLGIGGDDDDDDTDEDTDDDSSSDESKGADKARKQTLEPFSDDDDDDEEEMDLSSDDDDDNDANHNTSRVVRDWGRSKKDYYHGDTADLEIGQEQEDALLEEEAAKELQAARYEQMKEEDFALSSDDDDKDDDDKETDKVEWKQARRHVHKLSRAEKSKLLDRQHPELLPLVTHFTTVLRTFQTETNVVTQALLEQEEGNAESIGATKLGQQYLVTKAMLQSCAGLNLAAYLLLKSEQASSNSNTDHDEATNASSWIQTHPVMKHLHKLNGLLHKLEDQVEQKVPGLDDQMDKLVKASALLATGQVDIEDEENADDDESHVDSDADAEDNQEMKEMEKEMAKNEVTASSDDDSSSDDDDDDSVVKEQQARARNLANETRFGLRANEVDTVAAKKMRKRHRQRAPAATDFGDTDTTNVDSEAGKALAATLNSIEQRSAVRKRKAAPMADTIDNQNEDDEIRRGLAMMEADLGPASDEEGAMNGDGDDDDDNDVFDPEAGEEHDFYAQMTKKSKSKKEFKKNLYAVKPKYPRLEEEIDGERAIGNTIMKNRGLVAHKNKLNRNPRVKKREQYRKALIRRKGAVREVRTDEGHKYGGEATGIKTNISRSRRLVS